MIDGSPFEGPFSVKRLAAHVAQELGLPIEEVVGRNRKRPFALARAIVAHFAYQRGHSYPQIGRALGRDHTSVLHAVRHMPGWLTLYPEAKAVFDRCQVMFETATKGQHAHVTAWRAYQARPVQVLKLAAPTVVNIASKSELARFRAARANLEQDERNRRQGSAKLSAALARVGGWR